jgi:hypothetical protein
LYIIHYVNRSHSDLYPNKKAKEVPAKEYLCIEWRNCFP